ncbi:MAG: 50S ribosomal protein L11 methyltransferase [Firmicutes bacterium]|nr:50S ribosomal protein L11 methyltransferase [Bacillota bacterium]
MAKWLEVKLTLNSEALEAAYAVLGQMGIKELMVEDSSLMEQARKLGWGDYFPDTPSSDLVTLVFYLQADFSPEKLLKIENKILSLSHFGLDPGPVYLSTGYIEEENWSEAWKAHYRPQRLGRVVIQPTWLEITEPLQARDLVIYLDPGRAFGSGTHPTTAMCINFLQDLELEGKTVWDVGTGSGILALVAEKLGAEVQAVDLDPIAVDAARGNRDFNGLNFSVREGSLENLKGTADLIVANIVADVIIPLIPLVQKRLQAAGFFIAAGIIESRAGEVLAPAEQTGLKLRQAAKHKEWVGYLFQKGG